MAITVPNTVKVTGAGVTTVTTSGVTTTTGSTFVVSSTAAAGVTVNKPTDSKSNDYGTAKSDQTNTGSGRLAVWVKENGAGGASHTFTVTYSAATDPAVIIKECAGAATASYDAGSLAQAARTNGVYTAGPTGTLAQANNVVLSFVASDAGGTLTYAGPPNITQETDGNTYWTQATGHSFVTSTAAVTHSWTVSGSGVLNCIFAIKEAAAGGTTVNPGVGSVAITGYAPTISQPHGVAPGVGSLAITGYAPTVAQPQAVVPGVGSIAFTGYAPAVTQTANQSLSPAVGAIALTGYAPTLAQTANQSVLPGVGALSFTGYAPSVTQGAGQNVLPGVGSMAFSGFAPAIAQTLNQFVSPGAGSVTFTGFAPIIAQSANQAVLPAAGGLAISGYAPSVVQASASVSLAPDAGAIVLTGYAPDVTQSNPSSAPSPSGASGPVKIPRDWPYNQVPISHRERKRRQKAEQWAREQERITERLEAKKLPQPDAAPQSAPLAAPAKAEPIALLATAEPPSPPPPLFPARRVAPTFELIKALARAVDEAAGIPDPRVLARAVAEEEEAARVEADRLRVRARRKAEEELIARAVFMLLQD